VKMRIVHALFDLTQRTCNPLLRAHKRSQGYSFLLSLLCTQVVYEMAAVAWYGKTQSRRFMERLAGFFLLHVFERCSMV
jgi:hypothetical protein